MFNIWLCLDGARNYNMEMPSNVPISGESEELGKHHGLTQLIQTEIGEKSETWFPPNGTQLQSLQNYMNFASLITEIFQLNSHLVHISILFSTFT